MIDLNNFKYINDTFGHDMGDNALEISAKLFNSCIKSTDFIARFGGDEFCIVLDVSDRSVLEEIVCRINRTIKEYNESGVKPYKISVSMGNVWSILLGVFFDLKHHLQFQGVSYG